MSDPRPPSAGGPQPPGATSIGGDRRKSRKGLWLALAAVAAVLALLLLLSQCGTDEDTSADPAAGSAGSASSSAGTTSSSADGSSVAPSSSPGGDAGGGASAGRPGSLVTADGRSLPELAAGPAGGLAAVTGQSVTGTAVRVLTVPADEGFWVGTSDADRVWVQLTGEAGESPYQVQEGDSVDFTGTVAPHDAGFAGQVGVDDAEGAAQLTSQAQHVEAPRSGVVLAQ